jgi:hypothetical protein
MALFVKPYSISEQLEILSTYFHPSLTISIRRTANQLQALVREHSPASHFVPNTLSCRFSYLTAHFPIRNLILAHLALLAAFCRSEISCDPPPVQGMTGEEVRVTHDLCLLTSSGNFQGPICYCSYFSIVALAAQPVRLE